jgi:catechol 2,3-dioxygenase-like lactoylglutathione lyase family enzyme
MTIRAFQHINTRSADVERTKDFYVRILGLTVGERPPFASKGYWLYLDGHPVLHLVQRQPGEEPREGSGNLDHLAFECDGLEAMRQVLAAEGLPFREAVVPRDQTVQIFVRDPDGIQVELNFAS